jgi:hypothetical protein
VYLFDDQDGTLQSANSTGFSGAVLFKKGK